MYPGVHASAHPDKLTVISARTGEALTYGQLEERSVRLANRLRSAGLRPGDHLALLSDNDARCLEVYWAAMRSGLYLTSVNSHLTAEEAAYIVGDCGARALIVSASLTDLANALVPVTPEIELRLSYGRARGGSKGSSRGSSSGSPSGRPASAGPRTPRGRRAPQRLRGLRGSTRRGLAHRARTPAPRRRHALLLRHHRAPQGRPARPLR